jgi:hypothetical protein
MRVLWGRKTGLNKPSVISAYAGMTEMDLSHFLYFVQSIRKSGQPDLQIGFRHDLPLRAFQRPVLTLAYRLLGLADHRLFRECPHYHVFLARV